jgi:hypothetical protein
MTTRDEESKGLMFDVPVALHKDVNTAHVNGKVS